jgi:hypothetical protein
MRTRSNAFLATLLIASVPLATSAPAFAQAAPPPSAAPPNELPPNEPPPNYTPPPPPAGYGSPPNGAAPPPPPSAWPRGPRRAVGAAEVRFEPEEPDLQLLTMSGSVPVERFHPYRHWWGGRYSYGWAPEYTPVCDQACAVRLAPGPYRLALSKNGGPPVPAFGPALIQGPSLLRGSYSDRSGVRAAGWVIGIGGLVGGIVMIVASAEREDVCDADGFCQREERANGPLLAGGIGVLIASSIVGGVLASQRDEAHLSIEPLRLSSYGTLRESLALTGAGAQPEGAALALHF